MKRRPLKNHQNPVWSNWWAIIGRCEYPSHAAYHKYGGKGITLDREWRSSFLKFYFGVGPRPEGHSLDRIKNDRGYFPGNVRWIPRSHQARNRSIVRLSTELAAEIRRSSESGPVLASRLGITKSTVSKIRRGVAWR